jgi:DNA repair exonuclease SbcCD nuclease subunit
MLEGILKQVEDACDKHPTADIHLYVAGDVFDRNQDTTRSEYILFLIHFLHPLRLLKEVHPLLEVFIIDGNHDRTPSPNEPSVLKPIKELFDDVFHIAVIEPMYVEAFSTLMIPYRGFTSAEMRTLMEEAGAQHVMAHECLSRMQTDTGWSPPRNQDRYIEIEDVMSDVVRGIYLGDIHKCQVMDKRGVSWYSGSPVTLDYGHRLPKGILHHRFEMKGGMWERVGDPALMPIDDPRIKVHHQLGKITRVEDIPWEKCKKYEECYLDMVVTPEVFDEMKRRVEGIFESKQVSYSSAEVAVAQQQVEEEKLSEDESVQVSFHYDNLLQSWVEDNLTDYPKPLKEDFLGRVEKDFAQR